MKSNLIKIAQSQQPKILSPEKNEVEYSNTVWNLSIKNSKDKQNRNIINLSLNFQQNSKCGFNKQLKIRKQDNHFDLNQITESTWISFSQTNQRQKIIIDNEMFQIRDNEDFIQQKQSTSHKINCVECDLKKYELRKAVLKRQGQLYQKYQGQIHHLKEQFKAKYGQLRINIKQKYQLNIKLSHENERLQRQVFQYEQKISNLKQSRQKLIQFNQIQFQNEKQSLQEKYQNLNKLNTLKYQKINQALSKIVQRLKIETQQMQNQNAQKQNKMNEKINMVEKQNQVYNSKLRNNFDQRLKTIKQNNDQQVQTMIQQENTLKSILLDQIQELKNIIDQKNVILQKLGQFLQCKNQRSLMQSNLFTSATSLNNIFIRNLVEQIKERQRQWLKIQISHIKSFYQQKLNDLQMKVQQLQSDNNRLTQKFIKRKHPSITMKTRFQTSFIIQDQNYYSGELFNKDAQQIVLHKKLIQIETFKLKIKSNQTQLTKYQQVIQKLQSNNYQIQLKANQTSQNYKKQFQNLRIKCKSLEKELIEAKTIYQESIKKYIQEITFLQKQLQSFKTAEQIKLSQQCKNNYCRLRSKQIYQLKQNIIELKCFNQQFKVQKDNQKNICNIEATKSIENHQQKLQQSYLMLLNQSVVKFNQTVENLEKSHQNYKQIKQQEIKELSEIVSHLTHINHTQIEKITQLQQNQIQYQRYSLNQFNKIEPQFKQIILQKHLYFKKSKYIQIYQFQNQILQKTNYKQIRLKYRFNLIRYFNFPLLTIDF